MTISCSQCHAQNRAGANFCSTCQASLTTVRNREVESFLADASNSVDRRVGRPVGSFVLGLICLVYLVNPTAGIIELLPDILPVIGNLDEGAATIGIIVALRNLGIISLENDQINYEGWALLISSLRRKK